MPSGISWYRPTWAKFYAGFHEVPFKLIGDAPFPYNRFSSSFLWADHRGESQFFQVLFCDDSAYGDDDDYPTIPGPERVTSNWAWRENGPIRHF